MTIYSSIAVFNSVGRKAVNNSTDVASVQGRLNDLMRSPRRQLHVDGACGPKTVGTIKDFQKCVLRFRRPDGRVDPTGKTILALNNPDSIGRWAQMSQPGGNEPAPTLPSSGGDGNGPRNRQQALEAALLEAESTGSLTADQRSVVRGLLQDIWSSNSHGFSNIGPGGMTNAQLGNWLGRATQVTRMVKTLNGAFGVLPPALKGPLAFTAPFIQYAQFINLLARARSSAYRVYYGASMAMHTVYFVHGGARPQLTAATHKQVQTHALNYDGHALEAAWSLGGADAYKGWRIFNSAVAQRSKMSFAETQATTMDILGAANKDAVVRQLLIEMSAKYHYKDPNVSDAMRDLTDDIRYGDL